MVQHTRLCRISDALAEIIRCCGESSGLFMAWREDRNHQKYKPQIVKRSAGGHDIIECEDYRETITWCIRCSFYHSLQGWWFWPTSKTLWTLQEYVRSWTLCVPWTAMVRKLISLITDRCSICGLYFWWFRRDSLHVTPQASSTIRKISCNAEQLNFQLDVYAVHYTICVYAVPIDITLSHFKQRYTVCVYAVPINITLSHSTQRYTICVYAVPFDITLSYFTQRYTVCA